ncbi:GntR family transcriptional regulator, partial [Actinomadura sp. WAC 06369]|uniref:GntR family transcriptional regulator n=1 Tax=Actinomadura sp. WAC 06369 TaxID=2203193 RepID=UPI000F789741
MAALGQDQNEDQGRQQAHTTGEAPVLYAHICNELIHDITAGRIPPGSWLPTGREIERRWGVSPRTSRRVLKELQQSGWAQSQGTRGNLATAGPAAGQAAPAQHQQPGWDERTAPDTTRDERQERSAPAAPPPYYAAG